MTSSSLNDIRLPNSRPEQWLFKRNCSETVDHSQQTQRDVEANHRRLPASRRLGRGLSLPCRVVVAEAEAGGGLGRERVPQQEAQAETRAMQVGHT